MRTTTPFAAMALALAALALPAQAQEPSDQGGKLKRLKEKAEKLLRGRSLDELFNMVESGSDTNILIATRELKRKGKSAGPALKRLLLSNKPRSRDVALDAIDELEEGAPETESALLSLYTNERDAFAFSRDGLNQRARAARQLGRMKSKTAIATLVAGLSRRDWLAIAEGARFALVEYGSDAVEPVSKAYLDAIKRGKSALQDGVVYRSLVILGAVGGEKSKAILVEALGKSGESSVALRHHAAIGLGLMKDEGTVGDLIGALQKEGNHYVQKYIVRALQDITGQSYGQEPARWGAWWKKRSLELEDKQRANPLDEFGGGVPLPKVKWKKKVLKGTVKIPPKPPAPKDTKEPAEKKPEDTKKTEGAKKSDEKPTEEGESSE